MKKSAIVTILLLAVSGFILGTIGVAAGHEALWRGAVLIIMVAGGMGGLILAIDLRSIKHDTSLMRARSKSIHTAALRTGRRVKTLDHEVGRGAMSHMPNQLARIEKIDLTIEKHLHALASDWASNYHLIRRDVHAATRSSNALHETVLAQVLENRLTASAAVTDMRTDIALRIDAEYHQIEALLALYKLLDDIGPLPVLRGWAASPDAARRLVELVLAHRPRTIFEIGSGSSTVLLAAALRQLGRGCVISLEHLDKYADETERLLDSASVSNYATVLRRDLVPTTIGDETWAWYDVGDQDIPSEIDLVFVDGPPGPTGPLARYPALPILLDSLSRDAIVVVDDANRADEASIVARWMIEMPAFEATTVDDETGTTILRRRPETVETAP